jgi:hypothetical protein
MGNELLRGKLAPFSGDLAWLDDAEAAAAAFLGGHLEIVTGSILGLLTGNPVTIRHRDVDYVVYGESLVATATKKVDRGDPAAVDKVVGDFGTTGAWTDMDLSAIVPAGALFVDLSFEVQATAAGFGLTLRKKGNANGPASISARSQAANVLVPAFGSIACSTGRVIQYYLDAATWTAINLTVLAWYLPVV